MTHHDSTLTNPEQALCQLALESGDYDELTDEQWVSLCEQIAKEHPQTARKDKE